MFEPALCSACGKLITSDGSVGEPYREGDKVYCIECVPIGERDCSKCEFLSREPPPRLRGHFPARAAVERGEAGLCRRYPEPRMVRMPHWCGEFRAPKPREPEHA